MQSAIPMEIRIDDLAGTEIRELLRAHLADFAKHSPPESRHALDLEGLRQPDITFWSVWENRVLVGCGALKQLTPEHGEIKSMRTVADHQQRGVATRLLQHIMDSARSRGIRRLSLETGSMAAFEPARRLYAKMGFLPCDPFGDYGLDSNSVFMTREL